MYEINLSVHTEWVGILSPSLNLAVIKESLLCQTHGQLQISQFVRGKIVIKLQEVEALED